MKFYVKVPLFLSLLAFFSCFGFLSEAEILPKFDLKKESFDFFQKNTLYYWGPIFQENRNENEVIIGIVTAYSSTPWETDEDPHITAAGTLVRKGIVANNYFPFGTKIKIPELFGDQIFVVEDRMAPRKWKYHFDIWFEDYFEALNFGSKITKIEILK